MIEVSRVPRLHFSCLQEKWVLETAHSISVEVYQNAVALLFSNITLDVIEEYIPHYVPMIYASKMDIDWATL